MTNQIVILLLCFCVACNSSEPKIYKAVNASTQESTKMNKQKLDPQWYQGKAEVNTYMLEQNRYNAIHSGEAILIFVSEDFLTDKQVKNDNYTNPNSIPILKNNQIRRFTTGLYDYSIFSSIFSPLDELNPLKMNISSQDWCGQTYMQLNSKDSKYQVQLNSYFENEGDQSFTISKDINEDAIFNMIRINPANLPIGEIDIIPSLSFLLLRHKEPKSYNAKTRIYEGRETRGMKTSEYEILIPELEKTMRITFQKESPHRIVFWEESYPSAFDGKMRTTKSLLKNTEWIDYWSKNNKSDKALRKDLQVEGFLK
jgi:hypothetical protein